MFFVCFRALFDLSCFSDCSCPGPGPGSQTLRPSCPHTHLVRISYSALRTPYPVQSTPCPVAALRIERQRSSQAGRCNTGVVDKGGWASGVDRKSMDGRPRSNTEYVQSVLCTPVSHSTFLSVGRLGQGLLCPALNHGPANWPI